MTLCLTAHRCYKRRAGIEQLTHKGREITMLESCQNAQERWGGVHLLIDRWLQERHELIGAYDALGAKPEALGENRKPCRSSAACWSIMYRPGTSRSTSS